MSLKVKLNTESLKVGEQPDASRKRKSESVHEDDAATLVGDGGELLKGILLKINPSLLDLPVEADSPKKTSQTSLGGYLNDSQSSLYVVHRALSSEPLDSDKELAISAINSLVAQRKSRMPPSEGVALPPSTLDSQLEKLQYNKPRYALQQTLPGVDYFTQASDIDPAVASKLVLGTATILPIPVNPSVTVEDAPKLRDVSRPTPHTTVKSLTHGTFRNRDVSHLYYGANCSYAPSYDSTHATIPYTTSLDVATAAQMRGVEDPAMVQLRGEPVPLAHKDITPEELAGLGIDELPEAYNSINTSYIETQTKLKRNAFLLARLKSLEAQRLRSSTPHAPSQEEQEVARKITSAFTDMLVHESPAQYYTTDQLRRLHPKMQAPQYYGTLTPAHSDMLLDNISVRPHPHAINKKAK